MKTCPHWSQKRIITAFLILRERTLTGRLWKVYGREGDARRQVNETSRGETTTL